MTAFPQFQIGIDLGGTKTEIILLNGPRRELFRKRVPTPRGGAPCYGQTLTLIKSLVDEAVSGLALNTAFTVGIGIPGTVNQADGSVQNANTRWLAGKPFQKDLQDLLGRPVALENDANCFTLAECLMGAAAAYDTVFGIILGTGCGGGLCLNKTLYTGRHGIAGEWGHFSIDPGGKTCYCGNVGCIDTCLSGTALSESYRQATGQDRDGRQIVELARQQDPAAARIFDQFLTDFGRALGGLISLLDPDAVVLGGGLSNIDELYTIGVEKARAHAFHKDIQTPVLKNKLGDSAGVYGAAWLTCPPSFESSE